MKHVAEPVSSLTSLFAVSSADSCGSDRPPGNAFPAVTTAHAKLPHTRRLVCLENGTAVVTEAVADAAVTDGNIDAARKAWSVMSQPDNEHAEFMKSILENGIRFRN